MKKNKIIIGAIINILIVTILLLLIILLLYPKIIKIENQKKDLALLLKDYKTLKTKGLPYSEFKKIKNNNSLSFYQQKILSKIDRNFYESNFVNNGYFSTFGEFLDSLNIKINGKLKEDYDIKYNKIYSVLPIYSEAPGDKNGVITDFKFINMIENLLYDFDLISKSPLGIDSISRLDDYSKNKSELSSDIYVIKLPLSIEGRKKNIIKFLSYIKDMGNTFLCNKSDVEENRYGCIYEKQLVINNKGIFTELDSIYMDEYIDSSPYMSIDSKNKNLLDIITKTPQRNEFFKMDIVLLFYVQGLPNYKIRQFISYVIGNLPGNLDPKDFNELSKTNFNLIKSRLKKLQSKFKNNKFISHKLNSLDLYLQSIKKDIDKINKDLLRYKDLMQIYNKIEKYKGIFSLITSKLDEIEKVNR